MQVMRPDGDLTIMMFATAALVAAAFMRPLLRTVLFVLLGAALLFFYSYIVNSAMLAQAALYIVGACSFIRNRGHSRWTGWTDHHVLHYTVTLACTLQVWNIVHATAKP